MVRTQPYSHTVPNLNFSLPTAPKQNDVIHSFVDYPSAPGILVPQKIYKEGVPVQLNRPVVFNPPVRLRDAVNEVFRGDARYEDRPETSAQGKAKFTLRILVRMTSRFFHEMS